MAKEKDNPADASSVFEVSKIRELIELMREHELTEVDLKQTGQRIRLRRGGEPVLVPQLAQPATAVPAAAAPPAAIAEPAKGGAEPEGVFIRSPTIGTFYASSKPSSPPFVKVGDIVSPDTIVCIVEAMKMFNEIPAGVSGKIVEVLVRNEEPVDNNKPLFRVIPT